MLILSYENEISLTCKLNSFSYERMSTKTRFEEEAKGNIRQLPVISLPKLEKTNFANSVGDYAKDSVKELTSVIHHIIHSKARRLATLNITPV